MSMNVVIDIHMIINHVESLPIMARMFHSIIIEIRMIAIRMKPVDRHHRHSVLVEHRSPVVVVH